MGKDPSSEKSSSEDVFQVDPSYAHHYEGGRKDRAPVMDKKFMPVPGEEAYHGLASWLPVITKDYLAGMTVREMASKHLINEKYIRFLICTASLKELASKHRQEIMEELLKDQIPLLKEVSGLTLATLREFIEGLMTDETRKAELTVRDARDLSAIIKEQHSILKLEMGQATERVEVVRKVEKDVTVILQDLKKSDPFVDYPSEENVAKTK